VVLVVVVGLPQKVVLVHRVLGRLVVLDKSFQIFPLLEFLVFLLAVVVAVVNLLEVVAVLVAVVLAVAIMWLVVMEPQIRAAEVVVQMGEMPPPTLGATEEQA
jgi:MFS superfamily sulfate permease-like transporter